MDFWKSAHGWAPIEAAGLLNKSMLEWQASLSSSLRMWLCSSSDGDLILAWANIGALVEGQLKLFLSVWCNDYSADSDAIKDKRGRLQELDGSTLEPLRQFFVKRIWKEGRFYLSNQDLKNELIKTQEQPFCSRDDYLKVREILGNTTNPMSQFQNVPFCPISASGSNFNPRNTQ